LPFKNAQEALNSAFLTVRPDAGKKLAKMARAAPTQPT
jgi:hypothetical protein